MDKDWLARKQARLVTLIALLGLGLAAGLDHYIIGGL